MKPLIHLLVITCVAFTASSTAFAKGKKKATLADFKGAYTGTATLTVSGQIISGPLSLNFTSNKTGKTGGITLSGSLSAGGATAPVLATIGFANGVFSIDNFVFNTIAQGSYPATARYTVGKNAISFQGVAIVTSLSYPFSGSIVTKTKGRHQTLTYTTVESISGATYTFTFTVKRKLKKSEL